jgi:predicted nucleic acid-binding protein
VTILDTSVLIEALGAGGAMRGELRAAIARGERLAIPSLVLYEWLRGPRLPEELAAQEALFPAASALPFGPDEARRAASLYRSASGARGREIDLAIAACALSWNATLWTRDAKHFTGVEGLALRS